MRNLVFYIIMSLFILLGLILPHAILAQQVGDINFNPVVENPAYEEGKGPVVLTDEAHQNFHTSTERYSAFARLLRRDGYVVNSITSTFTLESLQKADILVIANSLNSQNVGIWTLPTPSAFVENEIDAVETWVKNGGALFLIADHMPFPGAAEKLAERFGFLLSNGFAFNADTTGLIKFNLIDKTLQKHPVISGRDSSESVEYLISFTGQAFRTQPGSKIEPLMVLSKNTILLLPERAWEFSDRTPKISASGMLQGAVLRYGEGRVAMFGEAAMFTAQVAGGNRVGMSHPDAKYNAQFVLNVTHWLSGLLPEK